MTPLRREDKPIHAPSGCHNTLQEYIHVGQNTFAQTPEGWCVDLDGGFHAIYLSASCGLLTVKYSAFIRDPAGKIYSEVWLAPRGRSELAISVE